jgi:hypothetical protein
MISLKLNEAQAEWGAATLARIVEGVATGGLALPELMAVSFVEYLTTVQGITPPAKGARIVGSVDLSRGKAAINVDLGRAFLVTTKGVASSVGLGKVERFVSRKTARQLARVTSSARARFLGRAAVQKAKKEILTAADNDPISWYERQRRNGRFTGRVKMEIDTTGLENIRKSLHARVGHLLSGWNAAAARFKVSTPSWVSGKGGRGTVSVQRSSSRLDVLANNQVNYAGGIPGMQRRINAAGEIVAKRMERRAAKTAEKAMQEVIDK